MRRSGLIRFLPEALIICAGFLSLSGCGPKPSPKPPAAPGEIHRYGIPSAIIDYDVRGFKTGHEKLYFDHWGAREAKYIHTIMHMLGVPQEENILKVSEGRWTYTIDLPKSSGVREENPIFKAYAKDIPPGGILNLGDRPIEDMGGHKAGANVILGRTCQIWVVPSQHSQYCLWRNVPLLIVMQDGGVQLMTEAVKIDENVPVKTEIFAIPHSVAIKDQTPAAAP